MTWQLLASKLKEEEQMEGMTLKQYHRERFYRLCAEYRQAKAQLDTAEGKQAFVLLSLQIHAAKAHVPKRLWSLVNK